MSQSQPHFTEFGVHRDGTARLGLRTRSGPCTVRLSAWATSPTPDDASTRTPRRARRLASAESAGGTG